MPLGIPEDFLQKAAYLMGLGHDLGKATSYFQEKLKDPKINNPLTYHSELSAMITWDIIRQYGDARGIDRRQVELLGILAYLIVSKHHGGVGNTETFLETEVDDLIIEKQLEALDVQEVLAIVGRSEVPVDYRWNKEELIRLRSNSWKEWDELYDYYLGLPLFLLQKYLFSVLVASDKGSVILKKQKADFSKISINPSMVHEYKESLPKTSRLDLMREELFQEALANTEKLIGKQIFSLNMPTGTGKTLTSLAVACKIKELLNKKGPIIYCLPFTSVIDQNYKVFYDVIKKSQNDVQPTSVQLLKHHHLAEMDFKDTTKDWDPNESRFLIESWESDLIVTTFVQFFHTLTANANRMLIKFHKLKDSVIILDEIQAIPIKYWGFIRKVLQSLVEQLSCHIILVTATMPLIFTPNETAQLIEKPDKHFRKLDRTELILHLKHPLSLQEFYHEVEKLIESNEGKDILIVMNTIRSASKVYEHLLGKEYDREYFYLSSYIIPKQRSERIKNLKVQGQKPRLIITTQLIEAGVDIDVNLVIRDIGPWDAINQVAGRCNRHWGREKPEEVHIFRLVDERGLDFARIYGIGNSNELIDATLETLMTFGAQGVIPENKYWELNKTYFALVEKMRVQKYDKNLTQLAEWLEHSEVAKSFKMIEELPRTTVFIQLDDDGIKYWQKYCDIMDEKVGWERNQAFQEIKTNFLEYVINVNHKDAAHLTGNDNFKLVARDELKNFYDVATGYIKKE